MKQINGMSYVPLTAFFFQNINHFSLQDYLVNKPLQAAGMSADNVRG